MKTDQDLIFEAYTEILTEDIEEAKKVIAQVELWNGKKMKRSFKNQSSAEKFIKKMQDQEDVRGYNMYAEGLEEGEGKSEEDILDNISLEELSVLTPEEYEMVQKHSQNFQNFDANDWGYSKQQRVYFRKRDGGEDEEGFDSQYDPEEAPEDDTLDGGIEP